jgi:type IV fimbrial biogenesis protein FimT
MQAHGFTLSELLVTLAIAAAAMTLAAPAFDDLLAAQRATAAQNQIAGAIATARTESILQHQAVTLCPGHDRACLGRDQWHHGALVFVDADRNGRIDPGERVVMALPPLRSGERLYWRSFRNRSFLQFLPHGYTAWQNGSFLYCPGNGRARHARLVIVNAQGRVRLARDTDGDGIAEDADGNPLRCE